MGDTPLTLEQAQVLYVRAADRVARARTELADALLAMGSAMSDGAKVSGFVKWAEETFDRAGKRR